MPWWAFALVAAIALVYTVPWDAALISAGVWHYAPGRVAASFGPVPVEELLFIVLQTALVGLWTARLRRPNPRDAFAPSATGGRTRLSGTAGWLAVGSTGLTLMSLPGSLLAWASIPRALQAAVGGDILATSRRIRLLSVVVPVAFLCNADRAALALGIWQRRVRRDHRILEARRTDNFNTSCHGLG